MCSIGVNALDYITLSRGKAFILEKEATMVKMKKKKKRNVLEFHFVCIINYAKRRKNRDPEQREKFEVAGCCQAVKMNIKPKKEHSEHMQTHTAK